eukprot:TRINITY_DN6839_c0_g1_i1.p1 TRINITY_DN6839_c0_g1~~TRINITY_DN6839_c0_g1_i1.p1  ORF type:complete len:93 (-),score=9.34 TRINITY_DN6839_c0_g1_i1:338-616(-)
MRISWSINHVSICSLMGLEKIAGKILETQENSRNSDESCLRDSRQLRKFYFVFVNEVSDLCEHFLEAIERIFDSVKDENGEKFLRLENVLTR